ncbi:OmpP1/FadL family transporter [Parachlamydia acanthamoebae]|nr:outer membrane protein transport protein [Parachlamydia acanthamoebae]
MKFRWPPFFSVIGLATTLCLMTSDIHALVLSVKSLGMAAVGVAYPQDSLVGGFNPAGTTEVPDRLDLGFTWARDRQRTKIHGNLIPIIDGSFDAARTKDAYAPEFGLIKHIGIGTFCDVTLGIVAYNRSYVKTTYKTNFPIFGTSKLGLEYIHETLSPSIAMKFWDQLSVGISVNYMLQRIKVNGLQLIDIPTRTAHIGHVTNRGYNYSQGVGVTFGILWDITDCLKIGATYQPETSMTRFGRYTGFFSQRGKFNIPQKASGGISYRFLPCATIAFDVEYIPWSDIAALRNPLKAKYVTTTNPLLPGFIPSRRLGKSKGIGFGWRNQTFYRVGADYALNDQLIVRAGYRYAKTPIRRSQTVTNQLLVDVIEHYITCGATWKVTRCQEISAYYAHGFYNKVKGKNSIPLAFGGGESDISHEQNVVGIAWGMFY